MTSVMGEFMRWFTDSYSTKPNMLEDDDCEEQNYRNLELEELQNTSNEQKELDEKVVPDVKWNTCKICFNAEVETLLLPCLHVAVCQNCARNLQQCPLCYSSVNESIKIYLV